MMYIARKGILLLSLFILPATVYSNPPEAPGLNDDIEVIKNTVQVLREILLYTRTKPEIFP